MFFVSYHAERQEKTKNSCSCSSCSISIGLLDFFVEKRIKNDALSVLFYVGEEIKSILIPSGVHQNSFDGGRVFIPGSATGWHLLCSLLALNLPYKVELSS